jgi:hypothetical protein
VRRSERRGRRPIPLTCQANGAVSSFACRRNWVSNIHVLDKAVFETVHVPHSLVFKDVSREIANDLMNVDHRIAGIVLCYP